MNLTIDQWNHGYKISIQKCVKYIMNESLLLVKDMTSISKNVRIDKLADIVNKYNNT